MFSLLGDIRAHAQYRKVPILCVLGARGRIFPDDEKGNARVRRIVDYLILIDGDLQQLPEGSEHGKPLPGHLLGEPRRRSNDPPH